MDNCICGCMKRERESVGEREDETSRQGKADTRR